MKQEAGRTFGKYVPVTKGGQGRLFLPLERCADLGALKDSGYEFDEESRGLIRIAALIKEAQSRRAESGQRKHEFITAALVDFSQEAGTIDIVCPYCLGRINYNCPSHEGEAICGWYDETNKCDGTTLYSIDRANLVLGMPEVERYTCRVRGTPLYLTIYDLRYLREEVDRRTRIIQRSLATCDRTSTCDVELAKIFPLRVSLERTRRSFKEPVWELLTKDAISWFNTLSLEELGSLLERATTGGWSGR